MTARLAHIWRHPIKGIGSEALQTAQLSPEGALAGDRAWALLNAAAPDTDVWQTRKNYLQVASGPALAAVRAHQRDDGRVDLRHPSRPDLTFDPAREPEALHAWVSPLWGEDRPAPARLVKAPGHGMTDRPEPYVSIGNLSTLRALSQRAGIALDMRRFRINLWIDGLDLLHEVDLIDATISVGDVTLHVAEPIERCRAPDAAPENGLRDVGMLRLLEDSWNTREFGVYARVETAGPVTVGDLVKTP